MCLRDRLKRHRAAANIQPCPAVLGLRDKDRRVARGRPPARSAAHPPCHRRSDGRCARHACAYQVASSRSCWTATPPCVVRSSADMKSAGISIGVVLGDPRGIEGGAVKTLAGLGRNAPIAKRQRAREHIVIAVGFRLYGRLPASSPSGSLSARDRAIGCSSSTIDDFRRARWRILADASPQLHHRASLLVLFVAVEVGVVGRRGCCR